MFDPINNNFQNPLLNQNLSDNSYSDTSEYSSNLDNGMDSQYPYLSNTPYPNSQVPSTYSNTYSPNDLVNSNNFYAAGGEVRKSKKKKEGNNPYPALAEMIRQQGGDEDVVLAHINPLEAQMLKTLSGGGRTNPKTGLPQYGFFKNPGKWFKSIAGGIGGAVLGNLIMPGIGGVIGGALGNATGEAVRGRKNYGAAALKGAGIGAGIPTLASALGSGANALGATNVGSYLSNYGNQNAILPSLSRLTGIGGSGGSSISGMSSGDGYISSITPKAANRWTEIHDMPWLNNSNSGLSSIGGEKGFLEKLTNKTSDFLTDPKNLLTTGVLASSFLNRPKKETPEGLARDQKRYQNALMLTPEELARKEQYLLAEEQMKRRIQRNKFLPEERLNIDPVYVRTSDPEEYKKSKKWINYYNNPQFSGTPLVMKKGGSVPDTEIVDMEVLDSSPRGMGYYLQGITGGQDDEVPALLSDGEYVIPTDVVADIGDGNNAAGAKRFDKLILNVRKHKRGGITKLPPKAKSLSDYMR